MNKPWYRKYEWDAFLFLLPATVIIVGFHVLPMFYAFFRSMYRWDLISEPSWVGIGNYQELIASEHFWNAIKVTLYYALFTVPAGIMLSLFIALMLNSKIRGLSFYRTMYYLPVITSINAVAIVWNYLFEPQRGFLNHALGFIGVDPVRWLQEDTGILQFLLGSWWPDWLAGPSVALTAIMIMSVWKGLGYNVIIFLAGLQNIPGHLYEAAHIDGAGPLRCFRHITWPILSPVTFFVLVMSTISSFQVFAQIYIMTPNGGPNNSCAVIVYYLYEQAMKHFRYGYALAIATVLFGIIFTMTVIQKLFVEKKVHYS